MPSNATSSATRTHTTMKAATVAQAAAQVLGLDDVSRMSLALTIAAADEVEENSRFADRVRAVYELLPATKQRATSGSRSGSSRGSLPKALTSTLTPIKRVEGGEINPLAPLDPYLLLEVYGAQQLREALDLYPVTKLREGVTAVLAQHPGRKPPAKASKAALIEYIATRLGAET